ncbi:MAG: hypothetical protein ACI9YT_001114 [Halobacteriales archaeon]|jgi:hypothetical protein
MKRRTLLGAVAGSLGAATLAGCLGDGGDGSDGGDGGGPGTTTETPEPRTEPPTTTPPNGDGFRFEPGSDDPFDRLDLGDRSTVVFPDNNRPQDVRVWNAAEESREMTLVVGRDGETVLDRTVTFPADGFLTLTLQVPDDWQVVLRGDGGVLETIRIARESFDCNHIDHLVGVTADWTIHTQLLATEIACHGPSIAERSFVTEEGHCASGTESAAAIAFEGDSVVVDGTFVTPTPCYELRLATAAYDAIDDALEVVIAATATGDTCVQCIGAVDYEASVGFEHELPGQVVVKHRKNGKSTVVATGEQ